VRVGGFVDGWVGAGDMYVCVNTYIYMRGVVSSGPWESGAYVCGGVGGGV